MQLLPAFMASLLRAAPADVLTGFAIWCESWHENTRYGYWYDQSGNDRHLVSNDGTTFPFGLDAASGLPAYSAPPGNGGDYLYWRLPRISDVPQEYTLYYVLRVDEVSDTYLTLLEDEVAGFTYGFTHVLLNSQAGAVYQTTPQGISPAVAAGETAVLTVQLNAAGATVRKNGQVIATGIPYTPSQARGGFLYNQSNFHQLRGAQFGFALSIGNDSLDKIQALESRWMQKLGI